MQTNAQLIEQLQQWPSHAEVSPAVELVVLRGGNELQLDASKSELDELQSEFDDLETTYDLMRDRMEDIEEILSSGKKDDEKLADIKEIVTVALE